MQGDGFWTLCEQCWGDGRDPETGGYSPDRCPYCFGKGEVFVPDEEYDEDDPFDPTGEVPR
jgi:hypothetical protein